MIPARIGKYTKKLWRGFFLRQKQFPQQKTSLSEGSLTGYEPNVVTLNLSRISIPDQKEFVKSQKSVDPRGVAPRQPNLTDSVRHWSGPTPSPSYQSPLFHVNAKFWLFFLCAFVLGFSYFKFQISNFHSPFSILHSPFSIPPAHAQTATPAPIIFGSDTSGFFVKNKSSGQVMMRIDKSGNMSAMQKPSATASNLVYNGGFEDNLDAIDYGSGTTSNYETHGFRVATGWEQNFDVDTGNVPICDSSCQYYRDNSPMNVSEGQAAIAIKATDATASTVTTTTSPPVNKGDTSATGKTASLASMPFPVSGGLTYQASFDYKCGNFTNTVSSTTFTISVIYYAANNTVLDNTYDPNNAAAFNAYRGRSGTTFTVASPTCTIDSTGNQNGGFTKLTPVSVTIPTTGCYAGGISDGSNNGTVNCGMARILVEKPAGDQNVVWVDNIRMGQNIGTASTQSTNASYISSGSFGSASTPGDYTFPASVAFTQIGAPGVTTNKLYNVGGTLYWNGSTLATGGSSQWTTSGSNIYYNTGNVGVGTTGPSGLLHLYSTGNAKQIIEGTGPRLDFKETDAAADNQKWIFEPTAGQFRGRIFNDAETVASDWLQVNRSGTTVSSVVLAPTAGNVGIGTTGPLAKLHVEGQCVTGDTLLRRKKRRRRSDGTWEEYWEDTRIDEIKEDDEILTLDEVTGQLVSSKVKALMDMGVKEIYTLTTVTGKTIRTTANHPYLVAPDIKPPRVAIFVDAANLEMSAKLLHLKFDYKDIMKAFPGGGLRYYSVDFATAGQRKFMGYLSSLGAKIITKPLKVITQRHGDDKHKANFDVEIASDAILEKDNYDTLVLFSGDSDFTYTANKLKNLGKKVVVVAPWRTTGRELRNAADLYLDLYRMPFVVRRSEKGNEKRPRRASQSRFINGRDILTQISPLVKGGKWTKVSELTEGHMIATVGAGGQAVYEQIAAIKQTPAEQVYDIEVENTHNFVGNGIVAHNTYLSGNVGIGTTAPAALLHVYGNGGTGVLIGPATTKLWANQDVLELSRANNPFMAFRHLNAAAVGQMDYTDYNFKNTGGTETTSARISAYHSTTNATQPGAELQFAVAPAGGTLTTQVVIKESGNVGIGTTEPTSLLNVTNSSVGAGNYTGGRFNFTKTSSTGSDSTYGLIAAVNYNASTATTGTVYGISPQVTFGPGSGTVTNSYGIYNYAATSSTAGGGTNLYMYYAFPNLDANKFTNVYGLYIKNINQATTGNYSIYSEGGTMYHAGNVGIGTTSPVTKLQVTGGNVLIDNNQYYQGKLIGGQVNNLIGYDTANWVVIGCSSCGFRTADSTFAITGTGGLVLGAGYIGTNPGAGNAIISGNVGIGTTSPAFKLDVNGVINIPNNTALSFASGLSQIYHNSTSVGTQFTGTSGSNTMIILDSGNVGIGTTSPGYKLDVTGDIRATGTIYGTINAGGGNTTGTALTQTQQLLVSLDTSSQGLLPAGYSAYIQNHIRVGGNVVGTGADVAEKFAVAGSSTRSLDYARDDTSRLEPGDVMVMAADMKIAKSDKAYDRKVVGVISTKPFIIMAENRGGENVALSGTTAVKVTGKVSIGDLLTTSDVPGYAMTCNLDPGSSSRSNDPGSYEKCSGAIIGKALEDFTGTKGTIQMLVMMK